MILIPDSHAMILFKFGPYKYMKDLKEGKISFSCPGKYIDIAKKTGNDDQGDVNEGVFARLKKGDSRIDRMKKQLGDDLEIIDDGEYVKLRRWSSYYIPTFCFYSYKASDILASDVKKTGWQKITHYFNENMYKGFGDYAIRNVLSIENRPAQLMIHAEPFANNLKKNLVTQCLGAEIHNINYTEFKKEEFFIEPTPRREELFYKFPKYSSQNETRVCLVFESLDYLDQRKPFKINSFSDNETYIFHEPTFFEVNVDIQGR
jgi:hypothetical protein